MARGRGKAAKTIALIYAARDILEVIQPASVRAICYQLFGQGVIASMAKSETNKVSTQLTYAREAGIIPWDWIVDEKREAEYVNAWDNLPGYLDTVRRSYRRNRWADQPAWLEVWSEKGTIRSTLAPVLNEYGITFRSMSGFTSTTVAYQVAQESLAGTKTMQAFYLGDWDPSGMHMSEVDLPRRLERYDGQVILRRLALDRDDVRQGDLPSFPAETKRKDPRYPWFHERFGSTCWELDALSPVVLRDRVTQAILARLDHAAWQRAAGVEQAEHDSIANIIGNWPGNSGPASNCSGAPGV